MNNEITTGVIIEPLDVLFFKDGRAMQTSSRSVSGLPLPQTFAGCMRSWLLNHLNIGFDKIAKAAKGSDEWNLSSLAKAEDVSDELRAIANIRYSGPWLAKGGSPLLPVPANLMQSDEDPFLKTTKPLKDTLPGWNGPGRPIWLRTVHPVERVEGYLTLPDFERYLNGQRVAKQDVLKNECLFGLDPRTIIQIDAFSQSAKESMLARLSMLALRKAEWSSEPEEEKLALYGEITGPCKIVDKLKQEVAPIPLPFGGERRYATFRNAPRCNWPELPTPPHGRISVVLTSPAPYAHDIEPGKNGLVAAIVPGYDAISGWDLARSGPKPNRFAAKAGSVFFYEKTPDYKVTPFCTGEDAAVGWGTYQKGTWDYA